MSYDVLQIKDCLDDDDLKRHLENGGKDTLRMYPCIDTIYYHLEVNLDDYITFRDKFILSYEYQNDTRFELKTYGDLTTKEFVYFKLHAKGLPMRENYENDLPLAQVGFNNPSIKNGRGMIYIQMNSKSLHFRGVLETDKIIRSILLDYGLLAVSTKITRIDYTAIIEGYDFSYLKSSLFKRRSYKSTNIDSNLEQNRAYCNRDVLETLYLGSRDYVVLRVYNKMNEMGAKADIMKDIVLASRLGYNYISEIRFLWTIEFECHRDFLKKYNILTFEDAYNSSVAMFRELMLNKFVLLIKDRSKKNSYRIPISKLWQKIAESYKIPNVVKLDLQKIKRKTYEITDFTILRVLENFRDCNTISPSVKGIVETCIKNISNDFIIRKYRN